MQYDKHFYEQAVQDFESAFKDIFADEIVLEKVYCEFSSRGYFKMIYKYLQKNYQIEIENEMIWFEIRIRDEAGANTLLYRVAEYDNRLEDKNIRDAISLLKKVLDKGNIVMYIRKGGVLYKKENGCLREIDISEM